MQDDNFTGIPAQYDNIKSAGRKLNFSMASDLHIGALLKTLAASKPGGKMLELGTGTGLATSWIIDGMDNNSTLVTVDNNEILISIAKKNLDDRRIEFICADGHGWIGEYRTELFDLIFADAIPGKYEFFGEALALLKVGGFYIVDDMSQQDNWPKGHKERVEVFIRNLEARKDLIITKLNWSTGIIIAVKVDPAR